VGSNPTPSAKITIKYLILLYFALPDRACAQSGAQTIWDDTDSIGLVVFVLVVAIIFVAAKLSRCGKCPAGIARYPIRIEQRPWN
jgi:hypothetical protein